MIDTNKVTLICDSEFTVATFNLVLTRLVLETYRHFVPKLNKSVAINDNFGFQMIDQYK